MDINNVILLGRLTKDIELRYTQSNIPCATIDLAVNNGKDKDGNERKADFIRVIIWEKQAENIAKFCNKGSRIAVTGSIKSDSYENEKGEKRYRTYVLANRIQFLDTKKSQEPLPEEPDYLRNGQQNDTQSTTQVPQADPYEKMHNQVEADFSYDDSDCPWNI